jgi:TctA family transporter
MHISRGDPAVFVDRPISLALFTLTAVLLIFAALPSIARARNETFQEAA